jgi:hypothetical protein
MCVAQEWERTGLKIAPYTIANGINKDEIKNG